MKKEAITAYKILKSFRAVGPKGDKADFSLLEVCPKTGRTHQIRVHLGHMGHAVVGDPLYGPSKQPSWATRLMLEAVKLAFKMPDGKTATFETEEELEKIIKAARRK